MIVLYEVANFRNYKQFWNEDLFDLVKSFDPSGDNRYEAWLLDTFRRTIMFEVTNNLRLRWNLSKEWIKFYLQIMLVYPGMYQGNLSSLSQGGVKLFADKFGIPLNSLYQISVEQRENIPKEISQFLHSMPKVIELSNSFNRYIETEEDRAGLIKALNVHKWLSDSNRLTPDQKNISNFKTINQLTAVTAPFFNEYDSVAQNLGVRSRLKSTDYDIILEDDIAKIVNIKTFLGSQFWGHGGTSWCITSSEEYFNQYTNNSTAPCIYYILNHKSDSPTKMAFVEGDRDLLSNPSQYIRVQYRTPGNEALTLGDIKGIPDSHRVVLEKYLWIFQFLKGNIEVKQLDSDEFEYVHQVIAAISNTEGVHEYLYSQAQEKYYEEDNAEQLSYDDVEHWVPSHYNQELQQSEHEHKKEQSCHACFGAGYAFTSKENGEFTNTLSSEEFEQITKGLKSKSEEDAVAFENAYYRNSSRTYTPNTTYTPIIKIYYETYPEDSEIFKIAEKYNNMCARCEGTGKHKGDLEWSHEQIDYALERWEEDDRSEFENDYVSKIDNTPISDIDDDLREILEDGLGRPLDGGPITLEDMTDTTNLEPIGQTLVKENGIKQPPRQQENLIKNLLRRYK